MPGLNITRKQLRSWRKRAETIKRSAERLMDEMMDAEQHFHTPANEMMLSDWADNISADADGLLDVLHLFKNKLHRD